jgi:hypothetical protein
MVSRGFIKSTLTGKQPNKLEGNLINPCHIIKIQLKLENKFPV